MRSVVVAFLAQQLLWRSTSASRDDSYYAAGTYNPLATSEKTMYWKDSYNILEDIQQFRSLSIKFHSCVWSQSTTSIYGDNDGEHGDGGGDDTYWYQGAVPPQQANVAFSLYGALKDSGEYHAQCNSKRYINSFYTTAGFDVFILSLAAAKNKNFKNYVNSTYEQVMGYTATCDYGTGVACAGSTFATYNFDFADYAKSSTCYLPAKQDMVDSLSQLNNDLRNVHCVEIYNQQKSGGSIPDYTDLDNVALTLLSYSSACTLSDPIGSCPDPFGKLRGYELTLARTAYASDPADVYRLRVVKSCVSLFFGLLLLFTAWRIFQTDGQPLAPSHPKKSKKNNQKQQQYDDYDDEDDPEYGHDDSSDESDRHGNHVSSLSKTMSSFFGTLRNKISGSSDDTEESHPEEQYTDGYGADTGRIGKQKLKSGDHNRRKQTPKNLGTSFMGVMKSIVSDISESLDRHGKDKKSRKKGNTGRRKKEEDFDYAKHGWGKTLSIEDDNNSDDDTSSNDDSVSNASSLSKEEQFRRKIAEASDELKKQKQKAEKTWNRIIEGITKLNKKNSSKREKLHDSADISITPSEMEMVTTAIKKGLDKEDSRDQRAVVDRARKTLPSKSPPPKNRKSKYKEEEEDERPHHRQKNQPKKQEKPVQPKKSILKFMGTGKNKTEAKGQQKAEKKDVEDQAGDSEMSTSDMQILVSAIVQQLKIQRNRDGSVAVTLQQPQQAPQGRDTRDEMEETSRQARNNESRIGGKSQGKKADKAQPKVPHGQKPQSSIRNNPVPPRMEARTEKLKGDAPPEQRRPPNIPVSPASQKRPLGGQQVPKPKTIPKKQNLPSGKQATSLLSDPDTKKANKSNSDPKKVSKEKAVKLTKPTPQVTDDKLAKVTNGMKEDLSEPKQSKLEKGDLTKKLSKLKTIPSVSATNQEDDHVSMMSSFSTARLFNELLSLTKSPSNKGGEASSTSGKIFHVSPMSSVTKSDGASVSSASLTTVQSLLAPIGGQFYNMLDQILGDKDEVDKNESTKEAVGSPGEDDEEEVTKKNHNQISEIDNVLSNRTFEETIQSKDPAVVETADTSAGGIFGAVPAMTNTILNAYNKWKNASQESCAPIVQNSASVEETASSIMERDEMQNEAKLENNRNNQASLDRTNEAKKSETVPEPQESCAPVVSSIGERDEKKKEVKLENNVNNKSNLDRTNEDKKSPETAAQPPAIHRRSPSQGSPPVESRITRQRSSSWATSSITSHIDEDLNIITPHSLNIGRTASAVSQALPPQQNKQQRDDGDTTSELAWFEKHSRQCKEEDDDFIRQEDNITVIDQINELMGLISIVSVDESHRTTNDGIEQTFNDYERNVQVYDEDDVVSVDGSATEFSTQNSSPNGSNDDESMFAALEALEQKVGTIQAEITNERDRTMQKRKPQRTNNNHEAMELNNDMIQALQRAQQQKQEIKKSLFAYFKTNKGNNDLSTQDSFASSRIIL